MWIPYQARNDFYTDYLVISNVTEYSNKEGGFVFEAELNNSMTGKAIYDALPIRAKVQRWGGEIYFSIGVSYERICSRDL